MLEGFFHECLTTNSIVRPKPRIVRLAIDYSLQAKGHKGAVFRLAKEFQAHSWDTMSDNYECYGPP